MPDVRPSSWHLTLKALARARARGPGEVLALAASRMREAVLSEGTLVIHTRDNGDDGMELPGLSLMEATPSDGARYARDIGTDSARTFASRLTESTRCFVVVEAERLVHATWMTASAAWTREIHAYVHPPKGQAYVYESFTRPEMRGRGVYPFALREICRRAAARGLSQMWVAVEADNPPSLKAVRKAGFEEIYRIDFERKLGRFILKSGVPSNPSSNRLWISKTPTQ